MPRPVVSQASEIAKRLAQRESREAMVSRGMWLKPWGKTPWVDVEVMIYGS